MQGWEQPLQEFTFEAWLQTSDYCHWGALICAWILVLQGQCNRCVCRPGSTSRLNGACSWTCPGRG